MFLFSKLDYVLTFEINIEAYDRNICACFQIGAKFLEVQTQKRIEFHENGLSRRNGFLLKPITPQRSQCACKRTWTNTRNHKLRKREA